MKIFLIFAVTVAMANGCGQPMIAPRTAGTSRIVGGENARQNSWPWQVSLQTPDGSHYCGGTLIGRQWVLTAAHCNQGDFFLTDKIVAGAHGLSDTTDSVQVSNIAAWFPHPDYNPQTNENDIMLLKLANRVHLSRTVDRACVPPAGTDYPDGTMCWSTGWGYTAVNAYSTGPIADELQQADLPLLSDSECSSHFRDHYKPENMICAGGEGPGEDGVCLGDTGGPLVCEIDGLYHVVGVSSFVTNACSTSTPSVFARVSAFSRWIDRIRRNHH
ncbi:chymotrypsinogen A-like isoform X1 [Branchiostoma floridae]|uniref:Chymotrypsinogen A-like isoform X1 n=2 Tax=Branchiostoma floridae TaxID=7739 RepID=A0A9J7HLP9_BRAFL|nr:chymotrypsinogen A-like isoform X1 [Branchiostoma floridae]